MTINWERALASLSTREARAVILAAAVIVSDRVLSVSIEEAKVAGAHIQVDRSHRQYIGEEIFLNDERCAAVGDGIRAANVAALVKDVKGGGVRTAGKTAIRHGWNTTLGCVHCKGPRVVPKSVRDMKMVSTRLGIHIKGCKLNLGYQSKEIVQSNCEEETHPWSCLPGARSLAETQLVIGFYATATFVGSLACCRSSRDEHA